MWELDCLIDAGQGGDVLKVHFTTSNQRGVHKGRAYTFFPEFLLAVM